MSLLTKIEQAIDRQRALGKEPQRLYLTGRQWASIARYFMTDGLVPSREGELFGVRVKVVSDPIRAHIRDCMRIIGAEVVQSYQDYSYLVNMRASLPGTDIALAVTLTLPHAVTEQSTDSLREQLAVVLEDGMTQMAIEAKRRRPNRENLRLLDEEVGPHVQSLLTRGPLAPRSSTFTFNGGLSGSVFNTLFTQSVLRPVEDRALETIRQIEQAAAMLDEQQIPMEGRIVWPPYDQDTTRLTVSAGAVGNIGVNRPIQFTFTPPEGQFGRARLNPDPEYEARREFPAAPSDAASHPAEG
jgi:hypothetical protein